MATASEQLEQKISEICDGIQWISNEDVEKVALLTKEAYAKEPDEEGLRRTWEATAKFEKILRNSAFKPKERARLLLDGYWARYYLIRKLGRTPNLEAEMYYYHASLYYICVSEEETPELFVNWGYLLATIIRELDGKIEEAGVINKRICAVAREAGVVDSIAKSTNSRMLALMKEDDFISAISLAEEFMKEFPGIEHYEPPMKSEANIFNNLGLAQLKIKTSMEDFFKAIFYFRKARLIYQKIDPVPIGHIKGLENRNIMVGLAVLEMHSSNSNLAYDLSIHAKKSFEAGDKEEVMKILQIAALLEDPFVPVITRINEELSEIKLFLEQIDS